MAFEYSTEYLGLVGLDARSSTFCSALPAEYIFVEVLLAKGDSGLNAIHDHANGLTVGLPEYLHLEIPAERIHIPRLLSIITKILIFAIFA